jgi:hypothetical protein
MHPLKKSHATAGIITSYTHAPAKKVATMNMHNYTLIHTDTGVILYPEDETSGLR